MARGRMISKSLSTSQKFGGLVALGDLAEFAQLLYPMLVVHSDDFGRLQGDAFTVKLTCLPVSPRPLEDFSRALEHLTAAGLIAWYTVAGKRIIEIQNFDWHQQGLHKRTHSQFPDASGKFPEVPGTSGNFRANRIERKGIEEKGRELKRTPPNPPTKQELRKAEVIRNRVYGRCPHTPRHTTAAVCIEAIARERRAHGRAS